MSSVLGAAVRDLKELDLLASGSSVIHRLDPRSKVVVLFVFLVSVALQQRYAVIDLLPFLVYPLAVALQSNLPSRPLFRKIVLLLPAVLVFGLFNPFFDTTPCFEIGSYVITGGWLSLLTILLRGVLTISATLLLIATTRFTAVCSALSWLCIPVVLVNQLHFLYRYIFVLTEEAERLVRARDLRLCGTRPAGVSVFGALVGQLLLRSWERAGRVHRAMLARGYSGDIPRQAHTQLCRSDYVFVIGWVSYFLLVSQLDLPVVIASVCMKG